MSVLEAARKAYAKLKAGRNGHAETIAGPISRPQTYEINERYEKSPSYLLVTDAAGLLKLYRHLAFGRCHEGLSEECETKRALETERTVLVELLR